MMKKVTILALRGAQASSITGPMDAFLFAGVLWNIACGEQASPCFEVIVASPDGKGVKCANRLYIKPHCAIHEVTGTDLIIISAITGDVRRVIERNGEVLDWLKQQYRSGVQIASICTGAFLLAETGLLDGKTATTHWGFIDLFRSRYPLVHLRPEAMLTDEGDLYCSGGSNSFNDLSFYLIEKLSSREVAVQCAKAMIQDFGRSTQAPYAAVQFPKSHHEQDILAIQRWIEENYREGITISMLAERYAMSHRTLERRFKQATGSSPLVYLQKVRINAAKALLEKPYTTFEEVTYHVGYEDISSFRKIFQRHTGLRPKEYQRLFVKGIGSMTSCNPMTIDKAHIDMIAGARQS
ncbi:MAG TPA: helix-turn-helix domain-containing protein [Smithellaceae bacterium]|nr:helix-turn-helix domain-containing protein [Smithellaceae bacterium]